MVRRAVLFIQSEPWLLDVTFLFLFFILIIYYDSLCFCNLFPQMPPKTCSHWITDSLIFLIYCVIWSSTLLPAARRRPFLRKISWRRRSQLRSARDYRVSVCLADSRYVCVSGPFENVAGGFKELFTEWSLGFSSLAYFSFDDIHY
jgi:hypothetical protein